MTEKNSKHCVLCVDDHPDTLRVLRKLLCSYGYDAVCAPTCDEAVAEAKRRRYQLLLADLDLPDCHGLELVQRIKKLYPIKAIAITGNAYEKDRAEALAAGYDHFLAKPVRAGDLRDAIGAVLQEA